MTKLEFIKKATPEVRWETWKALGSQYISANTKYLAANTIYKFETKTNLGKILLFSTKDQIAGKKGFTAKWEDLKVVNFDKKVDIAEITFSNSAAVGSNIIIVPNLYLIATRDQDRENISLRNNFIPFDPDWLDRQGDYSDEFPKFSADSSINISEKDYENCLKCLGYPFITEDELEYSKEDILNLAIKPALEEYFHWIPFERIEEYPITGQVQYIPFPTDAYDVLGVSVQQRGTHGSGNITNTLLRYFDEAAYGSYNYSGMTGNYKGMGKPHTAVSGPESFISNRALVQATTNLNTRVHFDVLNNPILPTPIYKIDEKTGEIIKDKSGNPVIEKYEDKIRSGKVLRIYSNKLGAFNIHWAIQSMDFNDVEYQQRQNVFKYCQAEIMQLFGNLRRQAKADIPGAIDYGTWVAEADQMKKEVVEDWKQLVKASSIIRGSL